MRDVSAIRNIYIYIYIFQLKGKYISIVDTFPINVKPYGTRKVARPFNEKWNKIFEKCRLLRFLLYQYSILSRKTVEEE